MTNDVPAGQHVSSERVKCRGYRFAVQWAADNDESAELDIEVIEQIISVCLVADLFNVSTAKVAADVLRIRMKEST